MPFRQRLRSAFLRFPCGYGGSQFTSRREDSELVPPARDFPPQAGSSDIESTPPPPAIPRIRRTPEEDSGRATGETKRIFAMGPDDDLPSSLREPGNCDNIGNPTLDPDSSEYSQLGNLYRLPSFENSTSNYSSHSITHSIGVIPQIPPLYYPERISAKHSNHDAPSKCFLQGTPVTGIGGNVNVNDLKLGENPAGNSSVTSGSGPVVCGGDIVVGSEGHLGVIDDRKLFKQGQEERELMVFKNTDRGSDKEDGQHKHAGLCADEIAQGITFKQNQDTPVVTTVKTSLLEPIVHARVQPREREEVTNVITRETHTSHIHPTIQPIVNQIYLPQKYYLERVPGSGQVVEITPEQAARGGWGEVWRGSWVVGHDRDMGCGGLRG